MWFKFLIFERLFIVFWLLFEILVFVIVFLVDGGLLCWLLGGCLFFCFIEDVMDFLFGLIGFKFVELGLFVGLKMLLVD